MNIQNISDLQIKIFKSIIIIMIIFGVLLAIKLTIWFIKKRSKNKNSNFTFFEDLHIKEWVNIISSNFKETDKNVFRKQKIITSSTKGHSLIVGGSGSGKTQKLIIPFIILNSMSSDEPSFIINDLKGELFKETSGFLKRQNYKIIYLNLNASDFFGKNSTKIKSNFYNPLTLIFKIKENKILLKENMDIVANFLFNYENERDSFWFKKSQELLMGLIYFMIETKVEAENFNIDKILDLFLNLNSLKTEIDQKNDSWFYLKDFFNKNIEKTIESVFVTFKAELIKYKNGIINIISQKTDFDFESILEHKTVIFLNNKGNNVFINNFLSLFISQINNFLYSKPEITLKRPIINILDEFANFTKIENFSNWLSITRQKNIWYVISLQNISQFENIYGKFSTFSSNFKFEYFLGSGDFESFKYFVEGYKNNSFKKTKISNKIKDIEHKTEIINFTKFQTLNENEMIIKIKGNKPEIKNIDYIYKINNLYLKRPLIIENNFDLKKSNDIFLKNYKNEFNQDNNFSKKAENKSLEDLKELEDFIFKLSEDELNIFETKQNKN